MAWQTDHLAPVETLLFRGDTVKVGTFDCAGDEPAFRLTPKLDNDVFVLPRQCVRLRRNDEPFCYVEPGGALMHRAGSELVREAVNDGGDRAFWFGIRPDIFEETLDRFGLPIARMGGPQVLPMPLQYRANLTVARLKSAAVDDSLIEADVLDLFAEICALRRGATDLESYGGTAARHRRLVSRARALINASLGEPLCLTELASAVGSSPHHLSRIFRQVTGMGLNQYRNQQRLNLVLELLLAGNARFSDIAHHAGFASHSHMNRRLKRSLGLTPSEIRASIPLQ